MLSKHDSIQRDQLEMITLDQLVPPNHLVRKMEAAINFTFIYDLVKDMYSEVGRPSIDPVILVKLTFIQYTFGIRSMRKTIEEVETNMAYRWFLGYGFQCLLLHVLDENNLNPVLSELHFSGSENSVEHE